MTHRQFTHINRRLKDIISRALILIIATFLIMPPPGAAAAPQTTESVIDTSKTGSITIHKLISNDGYASYADGMGHDIAGDRVKASGDGMAPLDKVIFSYKKVADLIDVAGDDKVGLYFQNVDPAFQNAVLGYNWSDARNRTVIEGETYYTTEQMEAALAAGNNHPGNGTSQTGTTALTSYLASSGTQMPACDSDGITSVSSLPLGLYLVGETDISAHDGRADKAVTFTDDVTGQTKSYAAGDYYLEDPNPEAPVVDSPAPPYFIVLPTTNITAVNGHEPGSVWIYDVDSWPKDQTLSITKKIVDPDEISPGVLRDYEDYQIGDNISQVIYADAPALTPDLNVPAADADGNASEKHLIDAKTHECYIISDQMTKGLSFDRVTRVALGPKVKDPKSADVFAGFRDLAEGTDYKITETVHGTKAPVSGPGGSTSFAVELLPAGLRKLDGITELSEVAVFFDATLNKDAKIGPATESEKEDPLFLNENHPTLTWRNSGSLERKVGGNHVYDFTYALDLTKRGLMKGNYETVAFTVIRHDTRDDHTEHDTDVRFVRESAGVYHIYDEHHKDPENDSSKIDLRTGTPFEASKVIHPDANGKLLIKGMDSNRYTFREIATEKGKELLKSTFDVIFTAEDPNRNGQLKTAEAEVKDLNGKDTTTLRHENGTAYLIVNNMKTVTLRTGGKGRTGIYAAGAVLLLLIFLTRRFRPRLARK